jgi:hypothetical protein
VRLPKLSYANVMSTIAVFIALGGTSYAVARNSIGTAQLKNNAVTSAKVKNGTLKTGDLAPSARIGQRGPRGPQGPAGGSGAAGGDGTSVALAPEPWQPLQPTLSSGWANYGQALEAGAYRKDKQGEVHLRGVLTQAAGAPSVNSLIATLPPGYRPAVHQIFSTFAGLPETAARVDIYPTGGLFWVAGPTAEPDYLTLSGISYWPD